MLEFVDGFLSLALIAAAAYVLGTRNLRRAGCGLVFFGLLMASGWGRLGAMLLVFIELFIGALMTGLLLWYALFYLKLSSAGRPAAKRSILKPSIVWSLAAGLGLVVLLSIAIGAARMTLYSGGIYTITGIALVGLGFCALVIHSHLLRKMLSFNVLGGGVFLLLESLDGGSGSHMLISAGLIVALVASFLTVVLIRMRTAFVTADPTDGLHLDVG